MLLHLPIDILMYIFVKLKPQDLRNLMLTCKTIRNLIVYENSVWRSVNGNKIILQNSTKNGRSVELSWYNRCRVSHNWRHGIYKSKVLLQHHTNYMSWLKYHNSEVLIFSIGSDLYCYPADKSGMPNCTNALWKLDVPKVKRYDVRTNDISRFIIKDKLLICGNRDGCVAVYKIEKIQQRPKLLFHMENCHEDGQVEVTAVELIRNNNIVTASHDTPHLLFWHWNIENIGNIVPNSCTEQTLCNVTDIPISYGRGIRCLAVNETEDKLAIGPNGNSKPILLDLNTEKFLITAAGTKNVKQAVRDIQWHNSNSIIYVTHSGKLQLVDIRSREVVYDTKDPFLSTLYCVKTDGNNAIVVGSSEYSRSVLFDRRNQAQHVQMYFTQKKSSPVYSLDFDSTKLIAAVDRGIAALNFNVYTVKKKQRDYSHVFHS